MFRLLALSLVSMFFLFACANENSKPNVQRHNQNQIPEIENLDNLIGEDPENSKLYFDRATVYYNNEGYQEAIDDLAKAIELDSSQVNYYHLLADSYLDNFKSKEAIKILKLCIVRFPSDVLTQLKLSEYYLILKQYERSLQTAATLLDKVPNNAEAYFMMAMNFRAMQDTVRAKNSFQAAIENDPELIDAWLILGDMYSAEGNPLALDYYKGALTADPDNILAKHSKAYYLQNNGNIEEAQKLYDEITLTDRNYVQAPLNSGILYLEEQNFEKAYEKFNIVVGNAPQNSLGYYYRGVCNESLNKIEAAIEDYQNSINLDPTDLRVREALDKAQKMLQ